MTAADDVAAVRALGFTARQARFLVLVLEHAGVCLPRQYRTFAGIAHGRQTHRFFERLITGGFATTDLSVPPHAGRIYQVQVQAVVPCDRRAGSPAPESDERGARRRTLDSARRGARRARRHVAGPRAGQGRGLHKRALVRACGRAATDHGGRCRAAVSDPFPIGFAADRSWLFLYLVTTSFPTTFRTFLTRHLRDRPVRADAGTMGSR